MTQLYPARPGGEPGEDDLGALSSWYVWAALGLYPETPGVADLGHDQSPLPPGSSDRGEWPHSSRSSARTPPSRSSSRLTWRSAPALVGLGQTVDPRLGPGGDATLSVDLGGRPDKAWGAAVVDAPPSFSGGAAPAVPFTTPGGAMTMASDSSTSLQLGVQEAGAADAGSVAWHVADPGASLGVTVSPASGTFMVTGGRADVSVTVTSGAAADVGVTFDLTEGGKAAPRSHTRRGRLVEPVGAPWLPGQGFLGHTLREDSERRLNILVRAP